MLNFFRRFRRDEFEEFFKELFNPLKPIEYLSHPADEILRAYLAGRLSNAWRLDNPQMVEQLMQGKLDDWQRAEVSAHVLTCLPCAKKLSGWRAAEAARVKEVGRPWGFRRWATALVAAFVVAGTVSLGAWWLWVSNNQSTRCGQDQIQAVVCGSAKDPDCESLSCGVVRPRPRPSG